jgi:hypothetical protein
MKLLIKFPTKGRKNKFLNTLRKYVTLANNIEDIKFLISVDIDDVGMYSSETVEIIHQNPNCEILVSDNVSKVDAINRGINEFEYKWDILLLASDDMIPQKKGYDDVIRDNMSKFYPDTDGVLWFNDGFKGNNLNTLSIMGKKYYDRFKHIYYPKYKSVWCDNEFMDVANILKKQTYIDDVIIRHEHPDYGLAARDEVHSKNFQNENHDKSLYLSRKQINFGL